MTKIWRSIVAEPGRFRLAGITLGWLLLRGADGLNGAPKTPVIDFEPNLAIVFLEAGKSIAREEKTPCTVRLLIPGGQAAAASNSWAGGVRIHGGVSQGYPKKSYALTLAAPARLLDLRASAHWVLNAAFIDRSLMRHKVSYDLFRSLEGGVRRRFAVASRFVEVYLNGAYQGAYLLMERVDRQLLELAPFQGNDVAHACIYKAVDHAANFGQPGHGGYEQREPDPLALAYWQPLDEFDEFVSRAPRKAFMDPGTGISARLVADENLVAKTRSKKPHRDSVPDAAQMDSSSLISESQGERTKQQKGIRLQKQTGLGDQYATV